jgi:hypothetical protein
VFDGKGAAEAHREIDAHQSSFSEVYFNRVRRKSYCSCRRKEREAFRAEREQADAALRAERREAAAAQERLRAETENLRASMERLQRRREGKSSFARGERIPGLGSVGELEER